MSYCPFEIAVFPGSPINYQLTYFYFFTLELDVRFSFPLLAFLICILYIYM